MHPIADIIRFRLLMIAAGPYLPAEKHDRPDWNPQMTPKTVEVDDAGSATPYKPVAREPESWDGTTAVKVSGPPRRISANIARELMIPITDIEDDASSRNEKRPEGRLIPRDKSTRGRNRAAARFWDLLNEKTSPAPAGEAQRSPLAAIAPS